MTAGDRPVFDASSTTDEVLADVDLDGRVAAVTGASGGLGLETARALAARGARVVLAARSVDKLDAAVGTIRAEFPDASLSTVVLDLADVASCRRAANDVLVSVDRLDLLINNAGVMCTPFGRTADGFETQIGTNHLGHMAWTIPLMDLLTQHGGGRIVNLSSAGHRFGDVDLDDLDFERRPYDPWTGYGASKTANVLFSVELERRLGPLGVHALAVHPGGIHTDLGRHMTPELLGEIQDRIAQSNPGGFDWKTIPQGAATTVWAATTPDYDERGGVYCEDCHEAPVVDVGDTGTDGVLAYAVDPERATALWDRSAALLEAI
jgi:NAD(P)-dependent dehydrogenase (short-subunit alcohol dehydrogenase family)